MYINFFLQLFKQKSEDQAVIWDDKVYKYKWLLEKISYWNKKLMEMNLKKGSVVVVEADFSPNSIALFLVLIQHRCIFVPITSATSLKFDEIIKISEAENHIRINEKDKVTFKEINQISKHEIYRKLKKSNHPGLVLFSSGSTGISKAAVHDVTFMLEKFKVQRNQLRTITFLLYDHIGGINTLLYTLSNGGLIATVKERTPDKILSIIERYHIELLPTSPTFINLILLSEAYKRYDLSSLKIVTYGTEPMPETTLKKFNSLFPNIKLLQTYGLSEVGILRSKSKDSKSLWVKVGGKEFKTRIRDNMLEIKAKSAMLGYLNAPSPFTEDGYFQTGDLVEVDGDFIKILGRKSEIINVGGEKVYPQEIENIILGLENIGEVIIYGENNPILGNIVCAKVTLVEDEDKKSVVSRIKKHCKIYLEPYKVPIRISISSKEQYSMRFKKKRILK